MLQNLESTAVPFIAHSLVFYNMLFLKNSLFFYFKKHIVNNKFVVHTLAWIRQYIAICSGFFIKTFACILKGVLIQQQKVNSHGFSPPFVQVSRCENLNAALKVSELRLEPGLAVGIE